MVQHMAILVYLPNALLLQMLIIQPQGEAETVIG
jgi:hypothetical protein